VRLVAGYTVIITEDLSVKTMIASAKAAVEKPGTRIRQKAGLNRVILDTARGGWLSLLCDKAEEAGARAILVDPRKQALADRSGGRVVAQEGAVGAQPYPARWAVIGRDQATAWVLWRIGQRLLGEEQARTYSSETVARTA